MTTENILALNCLINDALEKFGENSLLAYGMVTWHLQVMQKKRTRAFKQKKFCFNNEEKW
jgi:hypothetical protein